MKFLYFKDANNDAYMYPAANLISVIHDGDTTLKLFFAPASTNDAADTDLVTLTIASNKEQEVCDAIVGGLNAANAHSSGMVVVADALAGVFISPHITGTALTLDT
tara:strand:+ start:350 stop:667 length:318 start_codon:yes stop_codon:yes gene_type:complete